MSLDNKKELSHYELYQKALKENGIAWNYNLDARGQKIAKTEWEKAEKRKKRGPVKGKTDWDVFR